MAKSHLSYVELAKLSEKCNQKEGAVEDEEKDPVGPSHMEAVQWDRDEGQDQGQTQRSREDPHQQTLHFKLTRNKRRQNIMFKCSKTAAALTTTNPSLATPVNMFWNITCTSECVLSICTRHPSPTPKTMSEGSTVKDAHT